MNRNHRDPNGDEMNLPSQGRSNIEDVPEKARAPRGVEEVDGEHDEFDADDEGLDSDGKTGPQATEGAGERQARHGRQPDGTPARPDMGVTTNPADPTIGRGGNVPLGSHDESRTWPGDDADGDDRQPS